MKRSAQRDRRPETLFARHLTSASAVALVACGGIDMTEFGSPSDGADTADLGVSHGTQSVHATLETAGDDLLVILRNDSAEDARVSLELSVDTPLAHGKSSLGEFDILAGSERHELFSRDAIEGFDVAGSEWLRAALRYGFELPSGVKGRKLTSMAVRDGVVLDRESAIARGYQLPDMVLEGGEDSVVTKAIGDPFRICVTEKLTFEAVAGSFVDDNLAVDLSGDVEPATPGDTVNVAMTHFMFTARRGATTVTGFLDAVACTPQATVTGFLDAVACTPQLLRQTAGSETWSLDMYAYAEFNGDAVYGSLSAGGIPMQTTSVVVPASGANVFPTVTFAAGQGSDLNTATYLAYNSMRRLATINVVPQGTQQLMIAPSVGASAGDSYYCHTNIPTDCPTATTLRIGTGKATERPNVVHEFGHFIHATYEPGIPLNNTYSQVNADNFDVPGSADQPGFAAACNLKRSSGVASHNASSIEWQSTAHLEGLADFFQAVTYNDVTEDDCTIYQGAAAFDCEAQGRSFIQCKEWNDANLYFMVGNELDWTKMYWDFLTDEATNFHTYMLEEKDVTTWPSMPPTVAGTGDHWLLIRNQMSATMANQWNNSACLNLQDCTPSGRTQ
jgi:hypothetical protein